MLAVSPKPANARPEGGSGGTNYTFAAPLSESGGEVSVSGLSGTNSGDVTLGAVGAAPNANGASLAGQVLTLQPASGTQPGVVTTGAQTIAGAKTFSSSANSMTGLNVVSVFQIGGGQGVTAMLGASPAIDFGSTANGACDAQAVALGSATIGNSCFVTGDASATAGWLFQCRITSTGNLEVRGCNFSGGAVDPASDNYRIVVLNH